jgi:hypothetical protein
MSIPTEEQICDAVRALMKEQASHARRDDGQGGLALARGMEDRTNGERGMSDQPVTNVDLRRKAIELYSPPFRYEMGYIFDAKGRMVADDPCVEDVTLRIRGWGRISYLEDPNALQDVVGVMIAEAITEYWRKRREAPDGP